MIGLFAVVMGGLVTALGVLGAMGTASARRVDLYRWAAEHQPSAHAAVTLLGAPSRIHRAANAVIALGLAVAGLGLAALVHTTPPALAAALVVVLGVPTLLVLAYAVPRAIGRHWPEGTVQHTVPVFERVGRLVAPVEGEVDHTVRAGAGEQVAERLPEEGGAAPDSDALAVLAGVVGFIERPVREVMTPRTEIVALPEGATLNEVASLFADAGYSRIPLYRESLDNIVGMVYAFDLLKIDPGAELPIRPIATAPASKPCADLLFEMQQHRGQLAVVLDEYGGTAGIVTFQDLLEELVGEIFDEYEVSDDAGPGPAVLEVSGATPVDEVASRLDVELPDVAETIGGLLTRSAGRIPRVGERYLLGGLEFDVLSTSATHLDRIIIRRAPVTAIQLGARTRA